MGLLDEQVGYECDVQEGTYSGKVTVWVDEDADTDDIKRAAEQEWRRKFDSSIGMAYFSIKVGRRISG